MVCTLHMQATMNTLILLFMLVAAASAGTYLYRPAYPYSYGFHPYSHGVGPLAYGYFPGHFPGYFRHSFGFPYLVKAEEAEKEELEAEESSRKKRDAEDKPVTAVHYPTFAFPYGYYPYAHYPYSYPYAHAPVVRYEAPKVKTIKLKYAPFTYSAFPYHFPYAHVTPVEEKKEEESSRKKRDAAHLAPAPYFHGAYAHPPFFRAAPVVEVKPIEDEHKYKTVHVTTDEDAKTPAATVLAQLEEKEHSFKTYRYPHVAPLAYGHHFY